VREEGSEAAYSLRVSVLRLGLETFVDEMAMVRSMVARTQSQAMAGARLCVFPGLYGLCLAGPWPADQPWQATVRAHSGIKGAFSSVASRVARNARMYLVPGSVLVPSGGGFVEWTALFAPSGDLIGEQVATQPDPDFPELLLGERLAAFDTPIGPVGLVVGRDAEVPDVARILALQGARVLIAPRAPARPYSAMQAMAALWQAVQQNQVFGLESGLSGMALGRICDGKAGALAPGELSPTQSGFLGRPGYYVGGDALTADLDFERLEELRQRHPLARQLNTALYRRHADAFGGPRPAVSEKARVGGHV
jgi:predicted amidohydrolase